MTWCFFAGLPFIATAFPPVYAVYAISSLDTGVPLRPHPKATIVGTYQGVAGLAPRPFTLGEETGSHLRPSPPSPPPSVAAVPGHANSAPWLVRRRLRQRRHSSRRCGLRLVVRRRLHRPLATAASTSTVAATTLLFMLFMLFMQLARSTLDDP